MNGNFTKSLLSLFRPKAVKANRFTDRDADDDEQFYANSHEPEFTDGRNHPLPMNNRGPDLSSLLGLEKPEPLLQEVKNAAGRLHIQRARQTREDAIRDSVPMQDLRNKRVLIIGAGGRVGSFTTMLLAPYLEQGGMILVEPDIVEPTDLAFFPLYSTSDVGSPKVDAISSLILSEFPNVELTADASSVEHCSDLHEYIGSSDLIVMAADTDEALHIVCQTATPKKPVLWGAVSGDLRSSQHIFSTPGGPCLACAIGLEPGESLERGQGRSLTPARFHLCALLNVNLIVDILLERNPFPAGRSLLLFAFERISMLQPYQSVWLAPEPSRNCPYCSQTRPR